MRPWKVLGFRAPIAALRSLPYTAPSQASLDIEAAPGCHMAISTARHTDTTVPSSSAAAASSDMAHGSTAALRFHGYVDNRFDPHPAYHGPFSERGDKVVNNFHGNEMRSGGGQAGCSHR